MSLHVSTRYPIDTCLLSAAEQQASSRTLRDRFNTGQYDHTSSKKQLYSLNTINTLLRRFASSCQFSLIRGRNANKSNGSNGISPHTYASNV